jgi:hypothetical protein
MFPGVVPSQGSGPRRRPRRRAQSRLRPASPAPASCPVKAPARVAGPWRCPPGYPAGMSTSPLDPQEIRAAAEVYRELGPEYSDAVVAAFIDRVDRAVAARAEARVAAERPHQVATRRPGRRTLLKAAALGVCAGALVAGVSISHTQAGIAHHAPKSILGPRGELGPGQGKLGPGQGKLGPGQGELKPPAPPPPPAAAPAA